MLKSRHLLGIADLEPAEITLILDTAEAMTEIAARPIKKVPALRGRTVVNLFFEPSTRTRMSFEVAEKRLSADTLSIAVAEADLVSDDTLQPTRTAHNRIPKNTRIAGSPFICWLGCCESLAQLRLDLDI